METKLPGMVIELEAKIDKLERGLAKANRAHGDAATQMQRRAKQSADQMNETYGRSADKIAASFATLGKRVVPFVGAVAAAGAGAIATIDRVSKSIADTGDAARRAGLDFDQFQRLDFVARQNRIGVDVLTDGLKEMALRADELIQTGGGAGAEAFKRLGFSADQLKRKLDDPSDLFLTIIGRLEDLDRAAQIRVADEIFGGSAGERFVEVIAQGEDKLRATARRADELGLVLGDDVLRRAEEVNAKFEEIRARVANLGKEIVVNVAGALEDALTIDLDEIFGSAERAISMLGEETYRNMQGAGALDAQRAEVEELIDVWEELRAAIGAATSVDSGVRLMDMADIDAAYELAGILTDIDAAMIAFDNGATSAEDFAIEMGELVSEAEEVTTALAEIDATRFGGVIAAIGGISAALSTAIGRAAKLAEVLPGEGPLEPLATGPRTGAGRL